MTKKPNKQKLTIAERELLKERLRREGAVEQLSFRQLECKFLSQLFRKQQEVYEIAKKFNKAIMIVGRGGGKSYLSVAMMLLTCLKKPKQKVVYITRTKQMAMNITWGILVDFNEQLKLGAEFKYAEKRIILPNGSQLLLAGADDNKRIDDLRGQTFHFAIIDEAGQIQDTILRRLVSEVLEPRLYGPLWLVGTPGTLPMGFYYDASEDEETAYKKFTWSSKDNPFLPDNYLEQRRTENGWTVNSPIYRREYLGEWVLPGDDELVFTLNPNKNVIQDMPDYWDPKSDHWTKVLSIDYGFGDATAISLVAYPNKFYPGFEDNNIYVVASEKWSGKTPSDIALKTIDWYDRYRPNKVVGDTTGVGIGYAREAESMFREMRLRHNLTIQLAQKKEKLKSIEWLNDDLIHGRLKILEPTNGPLLEEMLSLQWRADRRDVLTSCEDDLCDSMRYAHREMRVLGYKPKLTDEQQRALKEAEENDFKPEDKASAYNRRLKAQLMRRPGGRRFSRSKLNRHFKN